MISLYPLTAAPNARPIPVFPDVASIRVSPGLILPSASAANLLLAYSEGLIQQYVRSGFQDKPTQRINDQLNFLIESLQKI